MMENKKTKIKCPHCGKDIIFKKATIRILLEGLNIAVEEKIEIPLAKLNIIKKEKE